MVSLLGCTPPPFAFPPPPPPPIDLYPAPPLSFLTWWWNNELLKKVEYVQSLHLEQYVACFISKWYARTSLKGNFFILTYSFPCYFCLMNVQLYTFSRLLTLTTSFPESSCVRYLRSKSLCSTIHIYFSRWLTMCISPLPYPCSWFPYYSLKHGSPESGTACNFVSFIMFPKY